jgi:carboxyl-terminal processing protease
MAQRVIAEAMHLVLERHLDAAAVPDLALWSLRGLGVLDPRFDVAQRDGQLRLTVEDTPLAAFSVARLAGAITPESAGAALGALLAESYEAAWRASAVLRRAGADRVIASGFDEVFNHLDPYSRYVTAAEARISRERRVGQSGLGLRIAVRGNALRVVAVTEGGPASEEGLRVGDQLLAVDGRRLSAAEPDRAAALLEGPEGSAVTLTLARGARRLQVTLIREVVVPETVTAERRDDILWVSVTGFSSQTEERIVATLVEGFDARPPRGVVLDLRGNRGGLLTQAVGVADAFLTGGEVARTEGRHPDAARRYVAGGRDLAQGRPVVVLVDGRTASAAEIVAMALAARHRAVVVGSATTGKGLIQLVAPLANEAELLITWSQVVSPAGWPVQGLGVLPELCTSLGPEALAAGLAALAEGRPPMAAALARQRAARPPVLASEVVSLRSACPPAEGRPADLVAARALIDSPRAYQTALRSLPQ